MQETSFSSLRDPSSLRHFFGRSLARTLLRICVSLSLSQPRTHHQHFLHGVACCCAAVGVARSRQSQTSRIQVGSATEMRAHYGFIHSHVVHVSPHRSQGFHSPRTFARRLIAHIQLQCALHLKVSLSDFLMVLARRLSFTVWACPHIAATVVEPYRTVLCVHSLLEHTDVIVVVENETMYDGCRRIMDMECLSHT